MSEPAAAPPAAIAPEVASSIDPASVAAAVVEAAATASVAPAVADADAAAVAAAQQAVAAAAVAAAGQDAVALAAVVNAPLETESKKRKARAVAGDDGAGSVDDEAAGENDEEYTDDEQDAAMKDVMTKMKEANEAALHTTAGAGGQLTTRGGEQRVQLYDSKRMSRVSFNSWYEFDAYFEMYMQETYQPFRMRSSCSVEAYRRNQQKVMMNNKNSRGRRIEFPDAAIHHHRIYMCTHAMKARCRGATTRPGQKYRGIGCIAKINVKISPSDNPNKYMVIVTDQVVTHNHPISKEIYESYPDVLLKTMRRTQMATVLLTRQPSPKFDTPSQSQKYERALTLLNSVADVMARMPDDEYENQLQQLQKFYANIIPSDAAHV